MSLLVTRLAFALLALLLAVASSSHAYAWEFNFAAICHEKLLVAEAELSAEYVNDSPSDKWKTLHLAFCEAERMYELRRFRDSILRFQECGELANTFGDEYGYWSASSRIGEGLAHLELHEREAAMKCWAVADAQLRERIAYSKGQSEPRVKALHGLRQYTLIFAAYARMDKQEWREAERCVTTAFSMETTTFEVFDKETKALLHLMLAACQIKGMKPDEARLSIDRAEAICQENPDQCRKEAEWIASLRKRGW